VIGNRGYKRRLETECVLPSDFTRKLPAFIDENRDFKRQPDQPSE